MSTVVVQAGEKLTIEFSDGGKKIDYDGAFEVHFDTPDYPKRIVVLEAAGLPGNRKGLAHDVLYDEDFSLTPEQLEKTKQFKAMGWVKAFDRPGHWAALLPDKDGNGRKLIEIVVQSVPVWPGSGGTDTLCYRYAGESRLYRGSFAADFTFLSPELPND